MSEDPNVIEVGEYGFYNFSNASPTAVIFNCIKINGGQISETDQDAINDLFTKIGLWENYISMKKTIRYEVENEDYLILDDNYRENALNIGDFCRDDRYFGEGRTLISVHFSQEESMRRTHGHSRVCQIDVDYIRKGLINVNKWLLLQKINIQ